MIKNIYKLFPKSLRTKVFETVADQVREYEARRAEEIEDSLPHVELQEDHIKNLRVLIDRDALINYMPKQSIVAELGVAQGNFSEKILSITIPKELHLIDSWAHDHRYLELKDDIINRFNQEIEDGRVFVHQGFSTTELAKFDDGYFDWIYIDTSHDYESTAKELEISRHKVKKDGIIAGHDYVTGHWRSNIRYGVIDAVHEFCLEHHWGMIYLTHESHRHISFAIQNIL